MSWHVSSFLRSSRDLCLMLDGTANCQEEHCFPFLLGSAPCQWKLREAAQLQLLFRMRLPRPLA